MPRDDPAPTLAMVGVIGSVLAAVYFFPQLTLSFFKSLGLSVLSGAGSSNPPFLLLIPAVLTAGVLVMFGGRRRKK